MTVFEAIMIALTFGHLIVFTIKVVAEIVKELKK